MGEDGPNAAEPQAPGADAPPGGATRLGRYFLGPRLGEGPTGVVYAAVDPELDRHVAIKILHGSFAQGGDPRLRQAQATAKLVHRNLVTIHDVGSVGERVFVAMELIDGPTLRRWLERPRPWREIVEVMLQVGEGLAMAHEAGIVHGDVKAENVLLTTDGRVVVTDFGLATQSESGAVEADALADQLGFARMFAEALGDQRVPRRLRRALARGCAAAPGDRHPGMRALLVASSLRRGPSPAVVLAGTATIVAAAVAVVAATPDGPPPTYCARVVERIEGIWSDEVQREIEGAFGATGEPAAADAYKTVSTRVEAFNAAWVAAQLDACRAQQDGSVAPEVLTLRVTCLERQLGKAQQVLEALRAAGSDTVLRVSEVVAGLGTPVRCIDDEQLSRRERARVGLGPEARAELDRALLRAEALVDTANYDEALTSAEALVERARGGGDRPADGWVAAEAQLVVASAHQWLAHAEAEQAFHDALSAALAVEHDRVAALAVLGLLELWSPGTAGGLDRAEQWRGHVDALISALGGDDGLRAELDVATGSVYLKAGRYDDAEAAFGRAIAARDEGGRAVLFANAYANLGGIAAAHGRLAEALERFRRGRDILVAEVGPRHPGTAAATINIGSALAELGDLEGARAEHLAALGVLEENFGPEHPALAPALRMLAWSGLSRRAWAEALPWAERALAIAEREDPRGESTARSLTMLSTILLELGRTDDAVARAAAGLEIALATLGKDHPASAEFEIDYAIAVTRLGHEAEARAHFDRAIALREGAFGRDDAEVGRAWAGVAELELFVGRHDAAVAAATRAHDIARAATTERGVVGAEASFLLARCLMAGGDAPERAQARRLADEARTEFDALGPGWRAHGEAITAWLASSPSD